MRAVIGFSQKIKRVWMEATLDQLLQARMLTSSGSSSMHDSRTICPEKNLGPRRLAFYCGFGPAFLRSNSPYDIEPLSCCPPSPVKSGCGSIGGWRPWPILFFRDAAEVVGRLLVLQEDFTTAQVRTRLVTTWGDRTTTKEAAQKLITTLVDWEALRSTNIKGRFLQANKQRTESSSLQLWLLEALLGASFADEIEAQQFLRLPEAFPFQLTVGMNDLRRHNGLDIHRQGLDMDMVGLRVSMQAPQPKPGKESNMSKAKAAAAALPSVFDEQLRMPLRTMGNYLPVQKFRS